MPVLCIVSSYDISIEQLRWCRRLLPYGPVRLLSHLTEKCRDPATRRYIRTGSSVTFDGNIDAHLILDLYRFLIFRRTVIDGVRRIFAYFGTEGFSVMHAIAYALLSLFIDSTIHIIVTEIVSPAVEPDRRVLLV